MKYQIMWSRAAKLEIIFFTDMKSAQNSALSYRLLGERKKEGRFSLT